LHFQALLLKFVHFEPGLFPAKQNQQMSLRNYFRESVSELHRVQWPTRAQATRLAVIVLVFTFIAAGVFGLLDGLLSAAYTQLINFAN